MKAAGELSSGGLQVEEEKERSVKNKVWWFLGGQREEGTKRRVEIQQPGDCMLSSVPSRNISVHMHCSKCCFLSGCHIWTFVTQSFQSGMNFRFSSGLWKQKTKNKTNGFIFTKVPFITNLDSFYFVKQGVICLGISGPLWLWLLGNYFRRRC